MNSFWSIDKRQKIEYKEIITKSMQTLLGFRCVSCVRARNDKHLQLTIINIFLLTTRHRPMAGAVMGPILSQQACVKGNNGAGVGRPAPVTELNVRGQRQKRRPG